MTASERQAVVRATLLLLLASLLRLGHAHRPVDPIFPPDSLGVLPSLIEETERLVAEEEQRSTPLGADERVALDTATEIELDRLPGIGPALAARIVALRESRGGFDSVDDLLEVSGIGAATLERIRPHVTVR